MINITNSHPEGVYYYMLFNLAAVLIGIAGAGLAAYKNKFSFRVFAVIVSAGVLSLVIGSKLVMFDSAQWLSFFSDGHMASGNGKSLLGAMLGGILGAWAAGKWCGNKASFLDLCAVSFPLALAVQRVGCLFAGCCHGVLTSSPLGITYGPGSKPFMEQQQLGIIPADAMTSLAVHPNQIYNILACTLIAVIAWRTSSLWKSPSGKFLFSVILYLAFRFVEEFTRYSIHPVEWLGLNMTQWIVLGAFLILGLLLFFREQKYRTSLAYLGNRVSQPLSHLNTLFICILQLGITLRMAGWLSDDERTLVLFTIFPLCGILLLDVLIRTALSQKYVRSTAIICLAFLLMSQKADKIDKPEKTPENYTAFNLTTALGKFNLDHDFNYRMLMGEDCEGNKTTYPATDKVFYRHSYKVGGLGIGRKVFYNSRQSSMTSLSVFVGREIASPLSNQSLPYLVPEFRTTLWGINPNFQYDGGTIGIGVGGSFGILGHDLADSPTDHSDYNPKNNVRKFSFQTRLRLFNERKIFVEALGGYGAGSLGDDNWQLLCGSRFNSENFMVKAGLAWSKHQGNSFVVHGQMKLAPRLYVTPELMIGSRADAYSSYNSGSKAAITLQYRFTNK